MVIEERSWKAISFKYMVGYVGNGFIDVGCIHYKKHVSSTV